MRHPARAAVIGLIGVALAALAATPVGAGPNSDPAVVAASVAPDNDRRCATSTVPVTLEPGTPLTPGSDPLGLPLADLAAQAGPQEVFVKLCLPDPPGGAADQGPPDAVQLLVHGITYDHRYWNIADPDDPAGNRYSWEHAAATAGYATLAIDRIGNGLSSHPPSLLVDISTNVGVVRQLVSALRAGDIDGPDGPVAFDDVILVGHSYGSMTSWFVASGNPEVAGLVVTGATHRPQEVNAAVAIETGHYPAILDPQFSGSGLDPLYVTTLPGERYAQFYAPGTDVDPRIVERDEATKGTFSQLELANYPIVFRTPLDIRVPTFYLIGDLDGIFCTQQPADLAADCSTPESVLAVERPLLGDAVPVLDAHVTLTAGHDLNAFRSAQESFGAAMGWLADTLPPRAPAPKPVVTSTLPLSRRPS